MTTVSSRVFMYNGRPRDVSRETIRIECGPTDLLVKIRMCCRCGSDRTVYLKGHKSVDPYAPVVLGHEIAADIVEVGAEVKTLAEGIGYRQGKRLPRSYLDFAPGERVTFQSRIARYRGGLMLIPNPIANLSFQINGGFSQYMRVPRELIQSESVLRVPEALTDEEACLVEPAACALEAVFATPHPTGVDAQGRHIYRAGIQPGGKTCIIGSGSLAFIYARLALLEGASEVFIVVRSEGKKRLVESLMGSTVKAFVAPAYEGKDPVSSLPRELEVVEELASLTGGYLFDDVVAACNDPAAQRLMLKLYTREGYAVGSCFGGTHTTVDGAEIDTNHYRAAKTIGSSGCSTDGMKTILAWMQDGRLDLKGLTSRMRFTLESDPHEFFSTNADGLKPVLYPWG